MRALVIIRRRTTRTMRALRSQRERSRLRCEAYRAALWFGADRPTAERFADAVR